MNIHALFDTVLLIILIILTMYFILKENDYSEYTRELNVCKNGACVVFDVKVRCIGNRVIDIVPHNDFFMIKEYRYNKTSIMGWCE